MLKKRLTNIALRSAAAVLLLAAGLTGCFVSAWEGEESDVAGGGSGGQSTTAGTYIVKASSQARTENSDTDTDDSGKLTSARALAFESSSGAPSGVTAFLGKSNKIDSTGFNLNGYLQKEGLNGVIINGLKSGDKISLTFKSKNADTTVYPVLGLKDKNSNPVDKGETAAKYAEAVVSDKSTTNTEATAEFSITADDDYILGTNNGGYIIEFSITR